MTRERAARRSLVLFCLAPAPLLASALAGRPGAGGALLLALMIAIAGVYELVRGAQ